MFSFGCLMTVYKFLVHYKTPKKRQLRSREVSLTSPEGVPVRVHVEVLRREIVYMFSEDNRIVTKITYLGCVTSGG